MGGWRILSGAALLTAPLLAARTLAATMLAVPAARLLGHGLFDRVHVADRPAYLTALSDAACGGEATMQSDVGKGTIVCIKAPLARADK